MTRATVRSPPRRGPTATRRMAAPYRCGARPGRSAPGGLVIALFGQPVADRGPRAPDRIETPNAGTVRQRSGAIGERTHRVGGADLLRPVNDRFVIGRQLLGDHQPGRDAG